VSVLAQIFSAAPEIEPIDSLEVYWTRHRAATSGVRLPVDRAILGGFGADRLAYAFVAGYQAALRVIAPDLPVDRLASLCITERGGGHPRAIETTLRPAGEHALRLDGHKRWASLADAGGVLLVAASEGVDEQGHNRLRVVRVEADAPGVTVTRIEGAAFVPEVGHAEVGLAGVIVNEEALLPGDGYTRVIRPFRTIEDVHVQAALFGYLLREARAGGFARSLCERAAALLSALRELAQREPSALATHIALGGVLEFGSALVGEIEAAWAAAPTPGWERWERDRALLGVAARAREARLSRAWERASASVPSSRG